MNLRNSLHRKHDEPHTGALNDILFILLFFFLIMATQANPDIIKVFNPKAKSDTKAKQSVVVTIDSLQRMFVGSHPINNDSLTAELGRSLSTMQLDSTSAVVINADKKANAENIVAVMKAARAQHLRTVLSVGKEE